MVKLDPYFARMGAKQLKPTESVVIFSNDEKRFGVYLTGMRDRKRYFAGELDARHCVPVFNDVGRWFDNSTKAADYALFLARGV